jgi:DNA-binding GntR family transcriptional regulator
VREALGRLGAEGLVTVRPRRGAVVSALSAREFLEAYEVREALESLAIRLAVEQLTPEEIDRLGELVEEQARHADRGNVEAFFEANAAFHDLIVEASGNETLQDMYRQLMRHMGRYRMRSLALRGTLRRSVVEHRAILRAVRGRDADKAMRLLVEHIRVPQTKLAAATDEEVIPRT